MWQHYESVKSGETKLDFTEFELCLLNHRLVMTEVLNLIKEFLGKMQESHPAYTRFETMQTRLLEAHLIEEVFDKELRTARQRANDLELAVLRLSKEKDEWNTQAEEIIASNEEISALYKENEQLKKKNEELIKML